MKFVPHGAFSTIVLFAFSGLVNSLTASRNCRSVEFPCQNGDCIESEKLCDGRADCSDQSDETRDECTKSQLICPEYAFRCNYGACVYGDAPCNGIDDCFDRSDELLPRCQSAGRNNSSNDASCTIDEFRCANGQCVPETGCCNGTVDCDDRSDEVRELCGTNPCPSYNFRCAYGACIENILKCNGKSNCADGSDEDPDVCRNPRPLTHTTTERFDIATESSSRLCHIPSQPQNGRWQVYKSQCPGGEHCNVHSTDSLMPGTRLIYSCENGYSIKGFQDVFCGVEGKWSDKPVCVETRCKPLVSASVQADSCMYNGERTSCESAVLPRTVATISCRNAYHQESRLLSRRRKNVRCNATGQWEPEPIKCIPKCGIATTTSLQATPLIYNGRTPKLSDFPWHATLYIRDGSVMRFICGATIIQNDLLITAAHCVYDLSRQRVDDANKFAVATGNIFRDYDNFFHDPTIVKKSRVARIYVICTYLGLAGNDAGDIAILQIETPFVFSAFTMPACLDSSGYGDQSELEVGKEGKVAGFGRTSSAPSSQVLQYLTVPVVSFNECLPRNAAWDTLGVFTEDKFCAGYTNGSAICNGDNGGGLVFKQNGLWYLRGIGSLSVDHVFYQGIRKCNEYQKSLYTKVSSHIEWIENVIIKLEKNNYPVCPNRSEVPTNPSPSIDRDNSQSLTASSNCRSVEFRCQNGDCISSEKLCDGRADCSDQSDETRDECTKPQLICPEYAFRCNYGACVYGDAPCDGIDDCFDRSDELLPGCQSAGRRNSSNNASCTIDEFRCNNGQCVTITLWCDGTVDCGDGTDETRKFCETFQCLSDHFRCAYGACIDNRFKCDGITNCADGSDEDSDLCRSTRPSIRTKTDRFDITTESPWRPCPIPFQPHNGRWQLYKSQCPVEKNCDVHTNDALVPGTWLVYSCANGYRVKGSEDVFCGPEGKWSTKPVCVEIRCKPLVSASIQADSCTYNDEWTSCESAVLPRTVAMISCRNGYHQEDTHLSMQRNNVRCNATGQWEPEPIRCIPKCGITTTTSLQKTPLIFNGELPRLVDFPWHATLYKREGSVMVFKCGATIIQNNLLITAAHCVYDQSRQRVYDANKFAIATGNTFRDYDNPLHNSSFVKKARVAHIYVICNYLGLAGNYAGDIAILHIQTPFVFSALLMPACLDTSGFGDQWALEVGKKGKVAGFGRTSSGELSQVLQYLTVPVVSFGECLPRNASSDTVALFTIDKLCAGYTNGSAVCDGDSGGGLVFQKERLWYLRGIVSLGVGQIFSEGTRRCNEYKESLYTKISSHIEWIKDVIIKLEMYNNYPDCPDRTMSRR